MSTLETRHTNVAPDHDRLSFARVMRSEFIKLTSLRSTIGLLLSIVLFRMGTSVMRGRTI